MHFSDKLSSEPFLNHFVHLHFAGQMLRKDFLLTKMMYVYIHMFMNLVLVSGTSVLEHLDSFNHLSCLL